MTEAVLASGRQLAESRMTSTCDIGRKTGATTTVDRLKVPTWALTHPGCPLRLDEGSQRSVTIGDVVYETATAIAHLPATTDNLADDDVIAVTAGEWSGTFWRVVKATMADQKTARRLPIEQTSEPAGWPA